MHREEFLPFPIVSLPERDALADCEELADIQNVDYAGEVDTAGAQNQESWFRRNKVKIAVGIATISATISIASGSLQEAKSDIVEAAPWVAAGVGTSEVLFMGGAAMMLAATGEKIGNPLKIKDKIPAIAQKANDSRLFNAGFWINATGAVGTSAVISIGAVEALPPEAWPVAALSAIDIAATVGLRKVIRGSIKKNSTVNIDNSIAITDQTS